MNGLDRALFHAINGWPDSLAPVLVFFSKGLDLWVTRIILLCILVPLIANKKTREGALLAALGWILANGATDLWKKIPFGRPGNELADAIVRIPMSPSMGTASAHSANMAFIATVFVLYFGWWGLPWVVVALVTGLSRIYVGAHYPSQVLLGWLTGSLIAWGITTILRRRKKPSGEVSE